ncbi:hypothetical protein [Xanthobacter sediminis]
MGISINMVFICGNHRDIVLCKEGKCEGAVIVGTTGKRKIHFSMMELKEGN